MEQANTIRIPNPSAALVEILRYAHERKNTRMKQLLEKLRFGTAL